MSVLPTSPAALYPGQRLTREEFLRRWEAMPDVKNAELIDGIVYMPSPVGLGHARHDTLLITWLGHYSFRTPGCDAANNATWRMLDSAPQPDACLRILPQHGGQSGVEGPFGRGAPELAVEVCGSSAAHGLGSKLALYQRAGVREYLTLVLDPAHVTWRVLTRGRYVAIDPDAAGILKSRVFTGLWLQALVAEDGARILAVLQQGLDSPEHTTFAKRLAANSKASTRTE